MPPDYSNGDLRQIAFRVVRYIETDTGTEATAVREVFHVVALTFGDPAAEIPRSVLYPKFLSPYGSTPLTPPPDLVAPFPPEPRKPKYHIAHRPLQLASTYG